MTASASAERAAEPDRFPIQNGVFVAVAGPSGAGKDTLIDYARRRLAKVGEDIVFVRRIITRPASSPGENHDALDDAAFEDAREAGRFSVWWKANGLKYALPAAVDDALRAGRVAVANVSRAAIPLLRERYSNVVAIIVTAPPHLRAERLAARGRETREEVLARLARATDGKLAVDGALVIENAGPAEEAGERLVSEISRALARARARDRCRGLHE